MADRMFLGMLVDEQEPLRSKVDRLTTHGVVIGMTGSGKTGLSITILEELALAGVPVIALDPKGDLSNLAFLFPDFAPADFEPWVDPGEAHRDGISTAELATKTATKWREGLAGWGIDPAQVAALRDRLALTVYTPGAASGRPVDVIAALRRPDADALADADGRADLVAGTVSALLGLVGVDADPLRSPEHLVTSRIVDGAWAAGEDLDLETLILRIVDPPFGKVGVFPVDRFWKPDDRMDLAMQLNAVVASPSFSAWASGDPLDVAGLLDQRPDGRTPVTVFHLAHLDEGERQFFGAMLLERIVAWSRSQPGTSSLRALVFLDEAFGYLPPHPRNPPTKKPLLTLMKQARAVGVGVLLATQNPVDIDYKALTNAGTWFIGRLSTEQDVKRVAEGLRQAGAGSADAVSRIGQLKPRQFVMRDVKESAPRVFGSRWAMTFLRGPTTLRELNSLPGLSAPNAAPRVARAPSPVAAPAPPAAPSIDDETSPRPPDPPRGVDALFLDPRAAFSNRMGGALEAFAEPARADGAVVYRPALYARIALRFDEDRVGFVIDEEHARVFFPIDARFPAEPLAIAPDVDDVLTSPPSGARFTMLPEALDEAPEWRDARKRLTDEVYRTETRGQWVCKPLKLHGRAGESREDFEERCRDAAEDGSDAALEKLADGYQRKIDRLEERVRRKESQLDQLEGRLKSERAQELLNGAELLASFFTKKKRRSFGSAASRRKATAGVAGRVRAAEEDLEALGEQLQDLQLELADKRAELEDESLAALDAIEEKEVRLERADVQLREFGLLWVPVTRRI
jgi:hypothetical protein